MVIIAGILCSSCIFNMGTTVYSYTEKGADESEERRPGDFTQIEASSVFNVYYVNSKECSVKIEGKQEYIDKVISEVNGGVLTLKLEPGTYQELILRVTVFSPTLEGIKLKGSGNFKDLSGMIDAGSMSLSTMGSGDMVLGNINCESVEASSAGSGDILISGLKCSGDCSVRTAGSGDVSVNLLTVDGSFVAKTAGSGDINIQMAFVKGGTSLISNGSGDIEVNGTCGEVNASSHGSGDISGRLTHTSLYTETKGSGDIRLN